MEENENSGERKIKRFKVPGSQLVVANENSEESKSKRVKVKERK